MEFVPLRAPKAAKDSEASEYILPAPAVPARTKDETAEEKRARKVWIHKNSSSHALESVFR